MRKGFSLIELVAVLVLVGAVAAVGSLGLIQVIQGFAFARDNAELAQKAEAALLRMRIEFSHIEHNLTTEDVEASNSSSASSLTYTAVFNGVTETNTITLVGDEVRLDGVPLTDKVDSLLFEYLDKSGAAVASPRDSEQIRITLSMTGANGAQKTFVTRAAIFAKSYENG
ncbi:MAG: prepilin-type N-terminal cleavage/methylation domain-containing protein [Pseudomonadota bacterium]